MLAPLSFPPLRPCAHLKDPMHLDGEEENVVIKKMRLGGASMYLVVRKCMQLQRFVCVCVCVCVHVCTYSYIFVWKIVNICCCVCVMFTWNYRIACSAIQSTHPHIPTYGLHPHSNRSSLPIHYSIYCLQSLFTSDLP